MKTLLLAMLVMCTAAQAVPDPRIDDVRQARSMRARQAFKDMHPCPSTGNSHGACPGWAVDHVIPLACDGADAPINMQWLPLAIKSCAGTICKDRWERKVYCP